MGAVTGGFNSACSSWGCFGARLCDVVGLCLVGDNLLILMLAKLLGVLFVPLNKAVIDSFTVSISVDFIFAERNKIASGHYCVNSLMGFFVAP